MKWNVSIDVRNPAWRTWKQIQVEAETPAQAETLALRRAQESRPVWSAEHEDYCPDDFTFTVMRVIKAD